LNELFSDQASNLTFDCTELLMVFEIKTSWLSFLETCVQQSLKASESKAVPINKSQCRTNVKGIRYLLQEDFHAMLAHFFIAPNASHQTF
jgi:hypothetical protein